MADILTPRSVPVARAPGRVSGESAAELTRAGQAAQGVADKFTAFYEEKARNENELLLATTQADWSRMYGERAKGAGNGFTRGILTDYDAYVAKVMETSPQRGRNDLKLAFDKYRINLAEKAMAREAAARAAAAAKVRAETLRQNGLALAHDPTPENFAALSEGKKDAEKEYLAGVYLESKIMTDPLAVEAELAEKVWDDYLTADKLLAAQRSARSAASGFRRAAVDQLNDELKNEAAYIAETGDTAENPALSDESIAALGLSPDDEAKIKAERDYTLGLAADIHAVNTASPEEIAATFSQRQAAATEKGDDVADVSARDRYLAAIQNRNDSIKADPAAHLQRTNAPIADMFENWNAASDDAKPIVFDRMRAYMDAQYDHLGVPLDMRTYLPKNTAAAMAKAINESPAGEGGMRLFDLREQFGDAAPAVMAQLAAAGLTPDSKVKMLYADKTALVADLDLTRGVSNADLAKALPSENSVNVIRGTMIEEAAAWRGAYLAGGNEAALTTFNELFETAMRVAMFRAAKSGMDSNTAVSQTVNEMFPASQVAEGQGVNFVAPEGVNVPHVSNTLQWHIDNIDAISDAIRFDHPSLPEFVDKAVAEASIRSNGVWVNNEKGDGVVLGYDFGGYIVPVPTISGEPIQFSFAELMKVAPAPVQFPSPVKIRPWQ